MLVPRDHLSAQRRAGAEHPTAFRRRDRRREAIVDRAVFEKRQNRLTGCRDGGTEDRDRLLRQEGIDDLHVDQRIRLVVVDLEVKRTAVDAAGAVHGGFIRAQSGLLAGASIRLGARERQEHVEGVGRRLGRRYAGECRRQRSGDQDKAKRIRHRHLVSMLSLSATAAIVAVAPAVRTRRTCPPLAVAPFALLRW